MAGNKGRQQIGEVIERVCEEENINSHELRMGSRRRRISQVRTQDNTSIGREFWNSTSGSSPPSGNFIVYYLQSP